MYYKFKKNRILIIDDSLPNVELVSAILKAHNIIAYGITDATKASSAIKKFSPDLILLDIIMPDISGFEICKHIKSQPEYSSIPIIFLTGADDEDNIIKAFEVGASDYVTKPVKQKELLARIETHIKLEKIKKKERNAYKELESFNHMVSHDLKTPIWTINKLTGYLKDYSTKINDDNFDELVFMICKKAQDTAYIIEKYSELAKLSTVELFIQEIDMNEFVNHVFYELNPPETAVFNVGDLPCIKADRLLLKQVLVNMFSNSIKFSIDRKPAIISVDCKIVNDKCVFSISDNGVGFNMKYSKNVFEMFTRLHSQKDFAGTGTGLAIVKKIIELHDGNVWMTGEENNGATIYFTLNL